VGVYLEGSIKMTVNVDWVLWLLATICFALGAFSVKTGRINMMMLGFTFIAITFLV